MEIVRADYLSQGQFDSPHPDSAIIIRHHSGLPCFHSGPNPSPMSMERLRKKADATQELIMRSTTGQYGGVSAIKVCGVFRRGQLLSFWNTSTLASMIGRDR